MPQINTVKTPNAEQFLAIEHTGGKILSAGAGSGKTFVLIEHMVTLLDQIRKETKSEEWIHVVPTKLARIVLMTFTTKAAGEMAIRMMNKIDYLQQASDSKNEKEFWHIVKQYLTNLNITTISSFCHKLIGKGILGVDLGEIKILSNVEYHNKISNLFDRWFEIYGNQLDQIFQANLRSLTNAMITIYSSPELRLLWKNPEVKTSAQEELKDFAAKISLKYEIIFEEMLVLGEEPKKAPLWRTLFQSFEGIKNSVGPLTANNIKDYLLWLDIVPKGARATKDMSEFQKEQFESLKELIAELKGYAEDILAFIDNYDSYWQWVEVYKSVFNFIDANYLKEPGFAFSDLEYYSCISLRNEEIQKKVQTQYDYFIVDEFQDTSVVQFEIIQALVGENTKRLFCVGDKKQAIYGFRGGEILVFNQCAEMLGDKNNLRLVNNFRSEGKVVRFNNDFFETVFPLGDQFEGIDDFAVEMEAQAFVQERADIGTVKRLETSIINTPDKKQLDLNSYEAESLYLEIKDLLLKDEIKTICVLYKNLAPSLELLKRFDHGKISYSAQIKIAYGDDPIINLFLRFLETYLNYDDAKKLKSTEFLIKKLLNILELHSSDEVDLAKIRGSIDILGPRVAFAQYLLSVGISNSSYKDNLALIDSICKVCNEDILRIYQLLIQEEGERYNSEIMSGKDKKRILIMTAHASKGLEYDAILVGGIYTNGLAKGKVDEVGKLPRSFRWKVSSSQRKKYKSPQYFLESDLDKKRNFAESKRLLYVACTRAVKYLGWCDLSAMIDGENEEVGSSGNHWINAFRKATLENVDSQKQELEFVPLKENQQASVLLKDNMGIVDHEGSGRLGVIAESSVTRLSMLAQCPFKFYLSNICKIDVSEISNGQKPYLFSDTDDEEDEVVISSKERGSAVHKILSEMIEGNISLSELPLEQMKIAQWIESLLKMHANAQLISEREIKFPFFGQMISGVPDLVLLNDDLVIWDFKTGAQHAENEEHYWFQLYAYGYAYGKLKHFAPEKMITLSLLYVDQNKKVDKVVSLAEITNKLYEIWGVTDRLYQVNLKHCLHCEYSSICTKATTSAH